MEATAAVLKFVVERRPRGEEFGLLKGVVAGVCDCEARPSAPHVSKAGADVKPNALPRQPCNGRFCGSGGPSRAVEKTKQFVGNEPSPRGVDMTIPVRALAVGEEALRHDQMEFVPGARHGDIKKTSLLLDFGVRARGEIRGDAAVDDVQHKDRLPFLALCRMNGRENQIILIQERSPGVIAGRIGGDRASARLRSALSPDS